MNVIILISYLTVVTLKNSVQKNKGSVSSKKYKDREERLLQKTIKTASSQLMNNHDLYENLDYNKLHNFSPNTKKQIKITTPTNFVNMKEQQLSNQQSQFMTLNQRKIVTSNGKINQRQKLDHKSLYPYISQTPQQKMVTFSLTNQQPEDIRKIAKTIIFDQDQIQKGSYNITDSIIGSDSRNFKPPHMVQRVLTNNNYSAMLNNIQKRKKINQLQNRFQQTLNMLPEEARTQMLQATQSSELLQDFYLQNQHSQQYLIGEGTIEDTDQHTHYSQTPINQKLHTQLESDSQYASIKQQQTSSKYQSYHLRTHSLETDGTHLTNHPDSPSHQYQQFHPYTPQTIVHNLNQEDPKEIAAKIHYLISQSSKLEKKVHDNLINSKMQIVEEKDQPNPQQKQYRVMLRQKEHQKISKHFSQLKGGLLATPQEENLKTRTHNSATYFYMDESQLDDIKKRKLDEQKLITDFVSEREAFIEQQNRTKRIYNSINNVNEDEQIQDFGNKQKSPMREMEAGKQALDEFLKNNKIYPKIFTADTIQAQQKPMGNVKTVKPNTNKKHGNIQKSVLLIQTQKFQQARQFLTGALKEYPNDVTLMFNKALALMNLKEYQEAMDIYMYLREQLSYKNAVLVNIFLCLLRLEHYEQLMEMHSEIEESVNFLDYDEKNLKKMYIFAQEKLKHIDYQRYEKHMKKQREIKMKKQQQIDGKESMHQLNEKISDKNKSLMQQSLIQQQEVNMFDLSNTVLDEDTLNIPQNSLHHYHRSRSVQRQTKAYSFLQPLYVPNPQTSVLDKKIESALAQQTQISRTSQRLYLGTRKASADTEMNVRVVKGLAQYISVTKKRTLKILNDKQHNLEQKYKEIQEIYQPDDDEDSDQQDGTSGRIQKSLNSNGPRKSINIYSEEDEVVDRLYQDKLKIHQQKKKFYKGLEKDLDGEKLDKQNMPKDLNKSQNPAAKKRNSSRQDVQNMNHQGDPTARSNSLNANNYAHAQQRQQNDLSQFNKGNNQQIKNKDSDLSLEFQEAFHKLENEMRESKEYFFQRLRKINDKLEDLGPQFDPVQQEYEKLILDIESLKREIGGEDKLYEFISNLKQNKQLLSASPSRLNSALDKKAKAEQLTKKETLQAQLNKYRHYQRAINVLLDTNNSQVFYKNKVGKLHTNTNSSKNISKQGTKGAEKNSVDHQNQNDSNLNNPNGKDSSKALQRQFTKTKRQTYKEELEEAFQHIEDRLAVYQKAKAKKETDDEKLMRLLGISKEQLEERKSMQKGITGHILIPVAEREEVKRQRESEILQFDAKTQEFLDYLFENYGVKQVMVPDTQGKSLFKEIQSMQNINTYINQMSLFVTNRSSDLSHLRKYAKLPQDQESRENATISQQSSKQVQQQVQGEDDDEDDIKHSEIENFQKLLEQKIVEKMSEKQDEESEFYQAMLQKLNTIDILQTYLKKCALALKNDEDQIMKKELTFAMLQIFREQISKKELFERQKRNNKQTQQYEDVDYDLIDKIVKRLKFFKIFDERVRHKLYRICRYQIVPPNRVILRKEEIDEQIIVIVNGSANLMVNDLDQQITYSISTLFPGESLGDVNLTSSLKYKEDLCQTYVKSEKECDVIVFDKKEFSNVLFQEMKDSLYEKIITLKNSEFFESISPYALVIICSNIEIKEYSYGDVIVRQQKEPDYCYIIVSGECKVAYETIVYKTREELNGSSTLNKGSLHFGFQSYHPSEQYTGVKKNKLDKLQTIEEEQGFFNQQKLNEKFSFQNDKLDLKSAQTTKDAQNLGQNQSIDTASKVGGTNLGNSSGVGGIMGSFVKHKELESNQLLAFRHHINYDKLVQGKCFCARALLEKDYVKKFIERELDDFKQQLAPDLQMFRNQQEQASQTAQGDKSVSTKGYSFGQRDQLASKQIGIFNPNLATKQSKISNQNQLDELELMNKQQIYMNSDQYKYDPLRSTTSRLEVEPILKGNDDKKDFHKKLNNLSSQALKREQYSSGQGQASQGKRMHGSIETLPDYYNTAEPMTGDSPINQINQSLQIKEQEIKFMYDQLMRSQLTVIADSANVKVIVISRKSKKYLSEPLKAVIDNKILNLKFKDYDRPFKNQIEINRFIENEKNWENYKTKVSNNNATQNNN